MSDDRTGSFADLRPGDVIAGKYCVERTIGSGGMGVVLAARHLDLDRRVAIKCLLPSLAAEQEAIARFAREARAVAKLQSEHVARVLDVGMLDHGAPYMVMEYLEGEDLGAALRRSGPLPLDVTVDFVLQACMAIAEAHGHGIIHRDLKPSNLFWSRRSDGRPFIKVLDFGISKIADPNRPGGTASASVTRTSAAMGSPPYMSPEQFQSAKDVDTRTDIWSLGVILFELLTATLPFRGEGFGDLAVKVSVSPPARLRALRDDVPAAIESVVRRCLEKDRSRRYANVAELALALLPFGPPEARTSVARISGTLQGAGSSATLSAPPSIQGRRETVQAPPSVAPWAATARGRKGRHIVLWTFALAGLAGTAGVFELRTRALWWSGADAGGGSSGTTPADAQEEAHAREEADARGDAGAATSGAQSDELVMLSGASGSRSSKVATETDATAVSMSSRALTSRYAGHGGSSSSPTVAPVNAHCDPPFYFDTTGQKIFKPECFH